MENTRAVRTTITVPHKLKTRMNCISGLNWSAIAAEAFERKLDELEGKQISSIIALHMLLWCPECGERHIDVGEFATKPHHTHACQHCGHVWRPAISATVGVQFLPGFKNEKQS